MKKEKQLILDNNEQRILLDFRKQPDVKELLSILKKYPDINIVKQTDDVVELVIRRDNVIIRNRNYIRTKLKSMFIKAVYGDTHKESFLDAVAERQNITVKRYDETDDNSRILNYSEILL